MTVSVVLVCRNEAGVIAGTIKAAQKVSADIVALDSGSTDGTQDILRSLGVKLVTHEWLGFGPTKNIALQHAQHDWVLQIDADERIDDRLAEYINTTTPAHDAVVYNMRFRNYLGDTPLLHGEWGTDKHIRLFNRKTVHWNDAEVHEQLILPPNVQFVEPPGYIHHVTAADRAGLRKKMEYYAQLGAQKYKAQGKKFSRLKTIFSPMVSFIVNYIFKLGFLDGKAGWIVANESARYTRLKYGGMRVS